MPKKYSDYVKEVKMDVKEISVDKLAEIYTKTLLIIDIREESECRDGMISGAINISRGVLESNIISALAEHKSTMSADIYLICRSGMRSVLAAQSLQNMGFENVYSIRGGMQAWIGKGLKIT